MTSTRIRPVDLLVVSVGGALGALLRLGAESASPDSLFPWPTLVVNVLGAFLLGLLPALAVVRHSRRVALAVGPGLLGGFTTVSAWAGETRDLADSGHTGLAGLYLAVTLAAGLGAAAFGLRIAHRPEPDGALE